MADPKLSSSVARSRADVSLDDSRAVMLESVAMFAILSSAIREVRFFESTEEPRTPLFETHLPRLRELLPVLDSLLSPPPDRVPDFNVAPEQHANELLLDFAKSRTEPDLLGLHQWLPQSAHVDTGWEAAKALLSAVPGFDFPPETLAIRRRAALAWMALASDESVPTRQATLDLFFDKLGGSYRAELAAEPHVQDPPVLRGEDLEALRRNAALFPPPEPSAPPELPSDAYLTAAAAAKRLRVAKSTVTRRIAQNRLIGFRAFTRALRIPKDQFDGDRVVAGVPDVLALFARSPDQPVDHRAAWVFLNSDLFHGDPDPRPIDRLRTAAATGSTPALLSELARTKESLDRGDHF